jgi:streptogramin lyase
MHLIFPSLSVGLRLSLVALCMSLLLGSGVAQQTISFQGYRPVCVGVDSSGNTDTTDIVTSNVFKISSSGTVLATFNTNSPPFNFPHAVVVDSSSNIFVVDRLNNRVVKLSPDGQMLAEFTAANPTFNSPIGMVLHPDGNLTVIDTGNNRLVKMSSTGDIFNIFTTSPQRHVHHQLDTAL